MRRRCFASRLRKGSPIQPRWSSLGKARDTSTSRSTYDPKELAMTDVKEKTESTKQQNDEALQRFSDGFSSPPRSPVLHSPSEHGLKYEDVTFPAHDGV